MKRVALTLATLFTLSILNTLNPPAMAQIAAVPQAMNFSGHLAKPDGTPVPDGTYSVRFSLWTTPSGGTEKWNQTFNTIAVRNGTFATALTGFPNTTFNDNLYLEIKVGTDAPLTPRQPLVSVAYAMKANSVPDGSITGANIANGAITADKFATGVLNNLSWLLGGNSGTNPATYFLGTTDSQPLVFRSNNIEGMRLTPEGRLGIGVSPATTLDVNGNMTVRGARTWLGNDGAFHWFGFDPAAGDTDLSFGLKRIAASEYYLIMPNGRIGIRTQNPETTLHLNDTSGITLGRSAINGGQSALTIDLTAGTAGSGRLQAVRTAGSDWGNLLLNPSGGNVGIGTNTPGQRLSVSGMIESLSGGVKFPDGTVQATAASGLSGAAGGDLTGTYPNPTIAANVVSSGKLASDATSLFKVSGGVMTNSDGSIGIGTATPVGLLDVYGFCTSNTDTLDQQQTTFNEGTGGADNWQSFTPAINGYLSRIELCLFSPLTSGGVASGSLSFYTGEGTGGTLLATQNVSYPSVLSATYQMFLIETPFPVTAGQKYTVRFTTPQALVAWVPQSNANPYAGGRANFNANTDYVFKTYVFPGENASLLVVKHGGKVGIGTTTPGQKLSVAGTIESTTGGVKFPDGTVQTTAFIGATAGGDLRGTYPNPTLANNSVNALKLADGVVSSAKLVNGAVITAKIANDNVTAAKLASDASALLKVSGGAMVSQDGSIGINTATPSGLLDIGGSIPNGTETLDQAQTAWTGTSGNTDHWQSFTAGASGLLTRIELQVSSPLNGQSSPGTLSLYAGEGTGGILLSTQAVTYQDVLHTFQSFTLDTPFPVTAGQQYTIRFGAPTTNRGWVDLANTNPYAGGRTGASASDDYPFRTYVTPAATVSILRAQSNGRLTTMGSVGIGTTTPLYKLHVNGSVAGVGNYNNLSDARYKTHVLTFDNALDAILNLRGVTFDWKRNDFPGMNFADGRQIGFIAQEVEKVLPELVTTAGDGYKSVAYANVVPVLVEAVKALKQENDGKEKRLKKIAAENAELRAELDAIKAAIRQLQNERR